tara:strand:- start:660 stop:905 length:246 start_codon:yes stop_codon:yes gene_type:complete
MVNINSTENSDELTELYAVNNYGRDMYERGVAGGKSLGLSLLHLELLKRGIGGDKKFLEVLNKLRDDFNEELDFLVDNQGV